MRRVNHKAEPVLEQDELEAGRFPADQQDFAGSDVVQEPLQLPEMQAETMAEIATRLAKSGDNQRISVATSLVNTWNYAVQVQGNRQEWNESDTRSFLIALAAIDSIGAKSLADEVEKALNNR